MASFYDSASIITIPSGYKAGTLYSAKPTDGSGDMTFTRTGDTATRVNSAGIIERCITNVLLQSNNFANASWTKSNTTIGSGITDPNGGTTAFSMAGSNSTLNSKFVSQFPFAVVNETKTLSIYAKANTHSFIQIRNSDPTNYANFDLTSGTFSAGATATAAMVSLGNGWYRCSITYGSSATGYAIQLVDSLAATQAATSTTTNSVYIWRGQAQNGDIATDYIDTTTAAVTQGPVTNLPRLDYLGSTCPQLLMEPTRTNLATYSQMFDNAIWTKDTSSVSGNVVVSPDGYTNSDALIENTASGLHRLTRGFAYTSGTTYAISCFVKQGSGTRRFAIYLPPQAFGVSPVCVFNLQTGLITTNTGSVTTKIENYGNSWYRCIVIATATATASNSTSFALTNTDSATPPSYTGDGTSSMYIWGAQVEAGAYATSYIPCVGATVTRNIDTFAKTSATSLIGQTEGVLFLDFVFNRQVDAGDLISLSDGTTSNRVFLGVNTTNTLTGFVANAGVTQANMSYTISLGNRYKCAIAYKANDFVLYVNGVQVGSDTSGSVPASLTKISNDPGTASFQFEYPLNQMLVFKTRLTNAELATLTTL